MIPLLLLWSDIVQHEVLKIYRTFKTFSLRNASTARFYSKYILTLLASVLCRSAQADKAPIGKH